MGRRYQAILRHLGREFETFDSKDGEVLNFAGLGKYDGFIVATPTLTHYWYVKALNQFRKPILCEKILSKNLNEVDEMLAIESPLSMVMQYQYVLNHHLTPDPFLSWYDYYNTGKDGLKWDCFQIIALAKGKVEIRNQSPIWSCGLNGWSLNVKTMDRAYVKMVEEWFESPGMDRELLKEWHVKVSEFQL